MFTLASVASSLVQKLQTKTPILLITDIGSDPDDILALLVLLASDQFKVVAIVTTGGDTLNRARVATRWLQVTGSMQKPAIVPDRSEFHAETPCNLPHHITENTEPRNAELQDDAVETILRTADAHGQKLGILCIGQMTSLAQAVKRQPETMRGIGFLGIQGQLVEDERGRISPDLAAFNLREDPEASEVVFSELQDFVPFHLVGKYAAYQILLFREDVEGVPFLLEDIRQSLQTFKLKNSTLFHKLYKEEVRGEEEKDFLSRLSHIATPFDPLLIISLTHPNLFEHERHGQSRWHTSIGNSSKMPGVVDLTRVRGVLKHYLNSHFVNRLE